MVKLNLEKISTQLIWVFFITLTGAVLLHNHRVIEYSYSRPIFLGLYCLLLSILMIDTSSGFYRLIFIIFIIPRFLNIFAHDGELVVFYNLDVVAFIFLAIVMVRLIAKRKDLPSSLKPLLTTLTILLALPPLFKFFDSPLIDRISVYAHFAILPVSVHVALTAKGFRDLVNALKGIVLISGGIIISHTLNNLL